jgi:hypothetical protein
MQAARRSFFHPTSRRLYSVLFDIKTLAEPHAPYTKHFFAALFVAAPIRKRKKLFKIPHLDPLHDRYYDDKQKARAEAIEELPVRFHLAPYPRPHLR